MRKIRVCCKDCRKGKRACPTRGSTKSFHIGEKKNNREQVSIIRSIRNLEGYLKSELKKAFSEILQTFTSDKELSMDELGLLQQLQSEFGLSNEEIEFEEKIMPYQYLCAIKNVNQLPVVHFDDSTLPSRVPLKKDEKIHFATPAILKEIRSVKLNYQGGSTGFSFKIAKGVNYRIGAHKGYMQTENQLVETGRGYFLITNKRVILQPFAGSKNVNIPINKVNSYSAYNNGIEIFTEGREKSYFFAMTAGQCEVAGLSLNFLLGNIS